MKAPVLCLVALVSLGCGSPALAGGIAVGTFPYYFAIDSRATLPSGTYAGLANPNFNRLTMLLNHGNHYHSIGSMTYTGPASSPSVVEGINRRIPEYYTGQSPLDLTRNGPLGTGFYNDKLVNNPFDPAPFPDDYSDIRFRSVDQLSSFAVGSEQHTLYISSGNRWSSTLAAANVRIELVSITPGLHVGTATNPFAMTQPGDSLVVGGTNLEFNPIFWTLGTAPLGSQYMAAFRLHDDNGVYGESGTFIFDFEAAAVIPEPGSGMLALGGVAILLGLSLNRSKGRLKRD
jgi:hypothetical protein